MKATLISVLTIFAVFLSGCETPVAVNPTDSPRQVGLYQTGFFYAPLDAEIDEVFQVAIRVLDDMGYFRTGEMHKDDHIIIYARKVGDQKVTVRLFYTSPNSNLPEGGKSMARIRVGTFGDLPESQEIYLRIRDGL